MVLTGYSGFQTASFGDIVTKRSWVWGLTPSLDLPLFTAGRLRSNLALTEAQREEAVLGYQQTIQQAFRDVSDALIALHRTSQFACSRKH